MIAEDPVLQDTLMTRHLEIWSHDILRSLHAFYVYLVLVAIGYGRDSILLFNNYLSTLHTDCTHYLGKNKSPARSVRYLSGLPHSLPLLMERLFPLWRSGPMC